MEENARTGPFPSGDETSATITLPDGRQLGYAKYGAKDGVPVICLHGLPGSRIDFARSDKPAKAAGARVIAVDRPGIGLSSLHPTGTLLTFAKDIETLTNTLQLDTYAVLGGSAGGPYSLACAYALPAEKLAALTVVCGLGNAGLGRAGMNWRTWMALRLAWWVPSIAWRWFWGQVPEAQTQLSPGDQFKLLQDLANSSTPHEREAGIFKTEESVKLWLKTSRESFKNGVDGPVQDTMRLVADWGFQFEDIRKDLPVRLWYGKFDGIAPIAHGEQIATRIGQNAQIITRHETHGSMFANRPQEYLAELVKLVKARTKAASS